jgi:HPt (histidine-containing phosphotransfer) domain-containing protein
VKFKYDHGIEIVRDANAGFLYEFIRPYLKDAEYTATIHPAVWFSNDQRMFAPVALSKFFAPVGGVIATKQTNNGLVFLLPQVADKEGLIVHLLKTALPELSPHLFPHFEGKRWLERDEYEHQSVLEFKRRQTEIQQAARSQIEQLDQEIEAERTRLGFLHGMLTKTGNELVQAVKGALQFIGFQQVKDVDAESEASANKQEDLRVLDPPHPLLLEIKGLAGLPREDDTLQVSKYVLRRMKQWNKTDIRGASIINHQRNLPALDRNHDTVFTPQQIEDAENHDIALLTTWNLFCLIRGMIQWKWPPEAIRDLLYENGRISAVPAQYRPIGNVTHFWDKLGVVTIVLAEGAVLRRGDTLGFVLSDRFHEERAESLQIDKQPVTDAQGGDTIGHKTSLKRSAVPDGTTVYLVKASQ